MTVGEAGVQRRWSPAGQPVQVWANFFASRGTPVSAGEGPDFPLLDDFVVARLNLELGGEEF